jgi:predicted short-subunit dehydrogenase-like oxidoreductase (DUF2520 family)
MSRTISIVGAGRVGVTLGGRLRGHGWRIGAVVTQSNRTSRAAVRTIGGGVAHAGLSPEMFAADVILMTTPDDTLTTVARALANDGGNKLHGKIVLHTSGTLDRTVLAPLARRGAATGSLHPMQTFSGNVSAKHGPKLDGVVFAIEGDAKARHVAREIARLLGGVPVIINGRDKPAYHATAVLVAGSGFALIEAASQMLMDIGFTRRGALQTLIPLTRQMLDNVERIGARAAWTGPISRGDFAIVARHTKALRRYPREFQEAYAALALLAGRVLAKKPGATLAQIKRALKNPRGGSR